MGRKREDITGRVFGRLTAVKALGCFKVGQGTIWQCVCACGAESEVCISDLKRGHSKSCKCAQLDYAASLTSSNNPNFKDGASAGKNRVIWQYKHDAKNAGREFSLTDAQFWEIVSSDCFYCGDAPKEDHLKVVRNGVDRKDTSLGYTLSNSVACCKYCNRAKSDLTLYEFEQLINKIHFRFNAKKELCFG